MSAKQKITDEQFIEAYVAAGGSYAGTAAYIQQNYDVSYSRTAAMKRARRYPDLKSDVRELQENNFDDHLLKFAEDETIDIRLRARIYLQMKSQARHMNMKQENAKNKKMGFFDINGNIISFFDNELDKEAFERIKKGEKGPGLEAWREQYDKKTGYGLPD